MTDSNATELFRSMLDERGVKWVSPPGKNDTTWVYDGWWHPVKVTPWAGESTLRVTLFDLTPEQAVAATLGANASLTPEKGVTSGAVGADDWNAALGSGTCEWVLEHSGTLFDKWRCSKCNFLFVEPRCVQGYTDLDPNYCPNCGKAVKR